MVGGTGKFRFDTVWGGQKVGGCQKFRLNLDELLSRVDNFCREMRVRRQVDLFKVNAKCDTEIDEKIIMSSCRLESELIHEICQE